LISFVEKRLFQAVQSADKGTEHEKAKNTTFKDKTWGHKSPSFLQIIDFFVQSKLRFAVLSTACTSVCLVCTLSQHSAKLMTKAQSTKKQKNTTLKIKLGDTNPQVFCKLLIFSFKANFGLQYLVQLAPQFALRGPRCEQSEQWGGVGTLSLHSASLMTRFVIKLNGFFKPFFVFIQIETRFL